MSKDTTLPPVYLCSVVGGRPDKIAPVANLAWIRRHSDDVAAVNVYPPLSKTSGAFLVVTLNHPRWTYFAADFGDPNVLAVWLAGWRRLRAPIRWHPSVRNFPARIAQLMPDTEAFTR